MIPEVDTFLCEPEPVSSGGVPSDPLPLSLHVRMAVDRYFSQLNGHPAGGLYRMVMAEVEKPLIHAVLDQSDYNQTKAASILGLSRSTLRKKMNHYGLS